MKRCIDCGCSDKALLVLPGSILCALPWCLSCFGSMDYWELVIRVRIEYIKQALKDPSLVHWEELTQGLLDRKLL